MNLLLANKAVESHGTDEGHQLERGFALAGWTLCGFGHDGLTDVRAIIDRYKPEIVVVQAREDWEAASPGCFDKRCAYSNISALASHDCFVVQVVKDCPGRHDRRKAWCEEVKADALLTYYHCDAVVPLSPWMKDYPRIRHRHTIDAEVVKAVHFKPNRRRAVVSGAINREVYPLRTLVTENASRLGVEKLKHPGYGNIGSRSSDYLRTLSEYKVSVACSSKHGFALRKLLESVAAGCMVVTDLPDFDNLPWLDDALVRVPRGADLDTVRTAIGRAEAAWTPALASDLRTRACEHYDWRACGWHLSEAIIKAAGVPA